MRYGEQVFEIAVPLDALDWTSPDLSNAIAEAFHRRHEALFTYALRGEEVVLVTARVAATGQLDPRPSPELRPKMDAQACGRRHAMLRGERQELPIYAFGALAPGQAVVGPAIVESDTTTVLLQPGDAARLDARGWLEVSLPAG